LAALALYIHVPFCRRRCAYCDFASTAGQEALIPAYVAALEREIVRQGRALGRPAARQDSGRVATVYLGGGTPSLLTPSQVQAILTACRAAFDVAPAAEITLEANPGTADVAYFAAIRVAGVNRLSLGVQSFDDGELALLGRIHTAAQAKAAYRDARAAGLDNVSLDLIYGLPGQSLRTWEQSLARAVALRPDHLSLYALEVHEDTLLGRRIGRGDLSTPDDDQAAAMYEHAEEVLAGAGFAHYEISNWARFVGAGLASAQVGDREGSPLRYDASICRHNLAYWRNEPYLGLGAAAHSWHDGERWWNVADPAAYIARVAAGRSPVAERQAIDQPTEMAETMFMGLRLVEEGVAFARFQARFGVDARDVYRQELRELQEVGLIAVQGDERVRLTRRGRLLGNEVFYRFVA